MLLDVVVASSFSWGFRLRTCDCDLSRVIRVAAMPSTLRPVLSTTSLRPTRDNLGNHARSSGRSAGAETVISARFVSKADVTKPISASVLRPRLNSPWTRRKRRTMLAAVVLSCKRNQSSYHFFLAEMLSLWKLTETPAGRRASGRSLCAWVF